MKGTLLVKLLTDYKLGPLELANPCIQGIRWEPFCTGKGSQRVINFLEWVGSLLVTAAVINTKPLKAFLFGYFHHRRGPQTV